MGPEGPDRRRSAKSQHASQTLDRRLRRLIRTIDNPARPQRDIELSAIAVETEPALGERLTPGQRDAKVLLLWR